MESGKTDEGPKEQSTLEAVNSKDNVESIKGRIIATHKLLKYLESTKAESEVDKTRIANLNERITQLTNEKTTLEQKLKVAQTLLEETSRQRGAVNVQDLTKRLSTLETELKNAVEAKTRVETVLNSNQTYIKQLEAQVEAMKNRVKSLEAENRKKDTQEKASKLPDKKDQEISDLQKEISKLKKDLEELHENYEALENDEMELRLNYDMQQTTIDELKSELERTKTELEQARKDAMTYKEKVDQHETTEKHADTANSELKKQLDQRMDEIRLLTEEVARLKTQHAEEIRSHQQQNELIQLRQRRDSSQPAENIISAPTTYSDSQDYTTAIMELRRAIYENNQLKKEKRVLQDKLTEQLLLQAEAENRRRTATLARLLPDYHPERADDVHSVGSRYDDFSTPFRRPSGVASLESFHDDVLSPTVEHIGSSDMHTSAPQKISTDISKSRASQPASTPNLPARRSTARTSPIPSEPNGKARFRSSDLIAPEPQVLPVTNGSRPKGPMSKIEKVAKARLPSSMATSSRKRAVDQQTTPKETPKKQRKSAKATKSAADIAASYPPIVNHVALIKTRIEEFSKASPSEIADKLSDMEVFATWKIDVMLGSLEAFYHSMKSPGNPIQRLEGALPAPDSYGVPDGIQLECPACFDLKEKNIAWFLWALSSTYTIENAYTKITAWAAKQAVQNVQGSNVSLAWYVILEYGIRYTRLASLLYRKGDDSHRLHILSYDIVRFSPPNVNFVLPLLNMTLVWSDILKKEDKEEPCLASRDLIIKSMQVVVADYCSQDNNNNVKALYPTLGEACGWPDIEEVPSVQDNIEELKKILTLPDWKVLYETDTAAYTEQRFNLVKSFELCFWRLNNWKATYDDFILKVLWPLLSDDAIADIVLELIGLLGRCGMPKDDKSQEKSGVSALRDRLAGVLQLVNECPEGGCGFSQERLNEWYIFYMTKILVLDEFSLQMTAARAFINLAPSDRAVKLSPLLRWFESMSPELEKLLTPDLRETYAKLRTTSNTTHLA
ncbi:hypothetical protein EC973_007555 [Apophysomyces ossiformis]|uniref:Uncharacterized protein n=1 Tax=Apophysomyces ossiformis TaxID=679940 RepID=A0A8H7EPP2_9FUNG|nr:hypothetical protein EC973_007555 [Apophysomyces ossiformis]